MSNTTNKPATQEDLQRAFNDLLGALTPEERRQLQANKSFAATLTDQRRAAILAHVDSPEAVERRRQMSDYIERSK